jgi:hypothetical protein
LVACGVSTPNEKFHVFLKRSSGALSFSTIPVYSSSDMGKIAAPKKRWRRIDHLSMVLLLEGLLAAETEFAFQDKDDRGIVEPEEKNIKPASPNTEARVMAGAEWDLRNEEGETNRISADIGTVGQLR